LLANVIGGYLNNRFLSTKALYIALVPMELARKVGGFQDLNRTEDVEFCARLAQEKMLLPLINPATFSIFNNVSDLEKDHGKKHRYGNPTSRIFVQTYSSERRYSRSFQEYLRRELNNKLDMVRGLGLTPTKILRELWFLRRIRGLNFLISVYYHIAFWLLAVLMKKEIYVHSKHLSNNVLSDYTMLVNYAEMLKNAARSGLVERTDAIKLIQTAFASEKARSIIPYARAYTL